MIDMMLTGRVVSAAEGKEIGFVTEVVPQGKALEEAKRWAGMILECSPMAIKATKACSGAVTATKPTAWTSVPIIKNPPPNP